MKNPNDGAVAQAASVEGLKGRRAAKRDTKRLPAPRMQSGPAVDGAQRYSRSRSGLEGHGRERTVHRAAPPPHAATANRQLHEIEAVGGGGVRWRSGTRPVEPWLSEW